MRRVRMNAIKVELAQGGETSKLLFSHLVGCILMRPVVVPRANSACCFSKRCQLWADYAHAAQADLVAHVFRGIRRALHNNLITVVVQFKPRRIAHISSKGLLNGRSRSG